MDFFLMKTTMKFLPVFQECAIAKSIIMGFEGFSAEHPEKRTEGKRVWLADESEQENTFLKTNKKQLTVFTKMSEEIERALINFVNEFVNKTLSLAPPSYYPHALSVLTSLNIKYENMFTYQLNLLIKGMEAHNRAQYGITNNNYNGACVFQGDANSPVINTAGTDILNH